MHKCLFVPYSLFIKNENFLSKGISEDHVWIESIMVPHEWILNMISSTFLKVFNIDNVFSNLTKWKSLMENDLLSMWQKLCVPSEILLYSPSSWQESCSNKRWHQKAWMKEEVSKVISECNEISIS